MRNAVFQVDASDVNIYLLIWPLVALAMLILIGITLLISKSERRETVITSLEDLTDRVIRRHTKRGGFHPVGDDDTTILPVLRHQLHSHWAITNVPWHDSQHPIDAPSTGRRAAANPHRTIVPRDWRPAVGERRIALIETRTVEIRRDAWRSEITRPYVTINA